ncbi:MAG: diguanylate cyclase [Rhodanobacteraceae bacterium]|nr:diguanylate cyclase [Rhodanobacteraceae bacterium]
MTVLGVTRTGSLVVGGAETLLIIPDLNRPHRYIDVNERLANGLRGSGDFWEFAEDNSQWCVRSTALLVCSVTGNFKVFRTEKEFGRLFQTDSGILIQMDGLGLCRVTLAGPELIHGGDVFRDKAISTLVESPGRSNAAIVNVPHSIWRWTEGEVPALAAHIAPDTLKQQIGIGVIAAPGRIAVPEENGGIAIIDMDGRETEQIDADDLGVGTGAQALLLDREGALWIAWRSAISRIEYPSRMRVFPLQTALFGQSLPLTRTAWGITSFNGSTLLSLRPGEHANRWEFQQQGPFLSPIMMIRSLNGFDFAGTINGIWSLPDGERAINGEIVFSVAPVRDRPDSVWAGLRNGVSRLDRSGSLWVETDRNKTVSFDVISVLQPDARTLWLGSMVGRVARLQLDEDGSVANAKVEEFGPASGLPRETISVEEVGGEVLFLVQGHGFHAFKEGRFRPSLIVPKLEIGAFTDIKSIDEAQVLVSNSNNRLRVLRRDITGVYRHQPSFFDEIALDEKVRSMHIDPDGIVWLSQDSKVVRIDPAMDVPKPLPQQVLIRDVSVGDVSLLKAHDDATPLNLGEGTSLRVEYTLPSYRAPELNRFRSRIRTIHVPTEWSHWSNETRRDFTNLPAGELLFEVEAQDAAGISGGIASVPMTVVAPWYRRSWAMAAFVVAGLLLVGAGVQWRVHALRARGAELERMVALKTEALQVAANTDPLTGLWNRHRFGQWLRSELGDIQLRAAVAAAHDPADLIVCGIDLDHFKRVNDQHGHAAGDAILKAVAERLQAFKRPNDLIFRFGGEEFVYIGTQRHRDEGRALAEAIVREIAEVRVELEDGVLLEPTASVGWSGYPFYRERPDLFGIDFVLGIADRALYVAKQEGRNRACGYLPNLPVDDLDRTQADWRTQVFNRHPDFLQRVG